MMRSFGEADHQKRLTNLKSELEAIEAQLQEVGRQQINSYLQPLVQFYQRANAYLQAREAVMVC